MDFKTFARLFLCRLGTKKNAVFFDSFGGLYNDSPLAVSKELHKINPDVKIYWVIRPSSKAKNSLPDYIKVVESGSWAHTEISARASVVVENGYGTVYAFVPKSKSKKYELLKNRKQYDITTWHGTPLKRVGRDMFNKGKDVQFVTTADLLVLGNYFSKDIFSKAFHDKTEVAMWGTPRNDVLCIRHDPEELNNLRQKLNLPQGKKIVLYAPTFRDDTYKANNALTFDYLMNLNVDAVVQSLKEKFGGEWVFVFRGHQFVDTKVENSLNRATQNTIYDGNLHDDMADYLLVSDVLITDYSSSFFDYAITKKPCFLYTPDREAYINNIRGIYGKMEELPFPMGDSNEDFVEAIKAFDVEKYKKELDLFMKQYRYTENGDSAKRIAELICEKLRR